MIQYRSPFKIIDLKPENGEIDKRQLKLSKKRLLAEFEVQETITISINGKEYDKNGILKIFDELESSAHLDHHIRIYNNKFLLSFLENGDLFSYELLENKDFEGDSGYVNFTGLYFSNRFSEILARSIKHGNDAAIGSLFENDLPVNPKFYGDCYSAAYRIISGKIREIETLADDSRKKYVPESFVKKYIDLKFINSLNLLPEYFSGLRDRYATGLRDLAISLYNTHKRTNLAKQVLNKALMMSTSPTVQEDVKDIIRQIREQTGYFRGRSSTAKRQNKNEGSSGWWLPMVIAIIMINLVRTCDSGTSSTSYDFKLPNTYTYDNRFNLDDIGIANNAKVKYGLETDFLDSLESASLSIANSAASDAKDDILKTGAQPYQGYFMSNVNEIFKYSSVDTPRDRIVFKNESASDVMIFIETVFGLVDHYYVAAGETWSLDKFQRMESQVGFHIWFGEEWVSSKPVFALGPFGVFSNSKGWIHAPMSKSSVNLGVAHLSSETYIFDTTVITFTSPDNEYQKTVRTTRVPMALYQSDTIAE
ncbi:MAG: hypothetical protein AAF502_01355 [Bacteroidota bacterium]